MKGGENMAVRITCINKAGGNHDDPHEAISNFGWTNEENGDTGNSSLAQMVSFIDNDKGTAYVKVGQNTVYCYTNTSRSGRKFVETRADGTRTDNLLRLPECVR